MMEMDMLLIRLILGSMRVARFEEDVKDSYL